MPRLKVTLSPTANLAVQHICSCLPFYSEIWIDIMALLSLKETFIAERSDGEAFLLLILKHILPVHGEIRTLTRYTRNDTAVHVANVWASHNGITYQLDCPHKKKA